MERIFNTNYFIGPNSYTLQKENLVENPISNTICIKNDFCVTDKADGERKMLYIYNNMIYLMNTGLEFQYSGLKINPNTNIKNVLIDGEHIEFDKYGKLFGDILHQCFQLYKKKYQLSHPGFTFFDNKIQKTTPKQGYHVWHIEDMSLIPDDMEGFQLYEFLTRFGVYTVYLNDVEEGGETEFLMQSLRISPKKGTLCLFPSSYTHLHRGNPPLKGNKYICTGWLHIPDTRENKNIILDNNE